MISSLVESTLKNANASHITELFLYIILTCFVLSLYWKKQDKHGAFTAYTPTLLTSLGILGTFTGIITGLLDFDTNLIDESIGPLLGGLKTAFTTSLAGMLFSILYKSILATGVLSSTDSNEVNDEDIDIRDLYAVMKQQVTGIEELKTSISGNDEGSLLGQFKLLRADTNENHKTNNKHVAEMAAHIELLLHVAQTQITEFKDFEERLWIKLQDFADMLSKSATEQVIEALKQVIQDFNNNLIEQFGDNFKALNEAVHELVTWQGNYKEQLQDMKRQYELGVQAITQTGDSVASISNEARVIPEAMSNLKVIMEVNQHQIAELDRHLDAFQAVRDKAVEAVPEIKDQIELAIAGAKQANDMLASGIVESSDHIKTVFTESADNYRSTVDQTRAALTESAQATANSSEEIKQQFSDALEDINTHMRELVIELQHGSKSLNNNFKEASTELISETNEVTSAFTRSVDDMKRSLAATIEEQASEHRKQADRVFSGLERSIEEALSQTGESVQKQVNMIDQTMGEEIQKVMQSMGSALASISGKFTEDYSRLVNRMSDVVKQQV
ncbi:hypothetical protein [Photobacterium atrarenae]|uniref:MotA/TolQ/ExbB proton channel domain-containing protein n=1 Tax=Photobacterium atrarenae TaxID=865757 RepID=A0ABY5GD96_9GAMM|nr:hypothetical protein [Photobacterium atrarenae]UTV27217.1 hypothetical protein NNL38_12880 [Photobacterium atrarenae]